ncbi:MAG: hypothetical protein A3F83_15880 [Candidatus Glassbacteria bacterium RIFCSPLOWO2_12_FULL_58_11]|uniref:HMA domain-containing protein n=2 Tax=Candidatus Glassiibacteriota TaxID=1817805 RepID=A0A1F5YZG8_9BACT|nr:MAG: hypothetical protein A2Z86_08135 [Candidatus Glassbacteria bacterium GWA2_58_10]OGG05292.1 MAG: hypothetical protein A3F83_15880 [Candidatus Glassbacteria bacterium RIFCSPLOWO2_12_FULL_58_11]
MKELSLKIEGMACEGCASAVQNALAEATGVSSAKVDLSAKSALVRYDSAEADPGKLIAAVVKAGYRASLAG